MTRRTLRTTVVRKRHEEDRKKREDAANAKRARAAQKARDKKTDEKYQLPNGDYDAEKILATVEKENERIEAKKAQEEAEVKTEVDENSPCVAIHGPYPRKTEYADEEVEDFYISVDDNPSQISSQPEALQNQGDVEMNNKWIEGSEDNDDNAEVAISDPEEKDEGIDALPNAESEEDDHISQPSPQTDHPNVDGDAELNFESEEEKRKADEKKILDGYKAELYELIKTAEKTADIDNLYKIELSLRKVQDAIFDQILVLSNQKSPQ